MAGKDGLGGLGYVCEFKHKFRFGKHETVLVGVRELFDGANRHGSRGVVVRAADVGACDVGHEAVAEALAL